MPLNATKMYFLGLALILSLMTSCTHPPYNNFQPEKRVLRSTVTGTASGAAVGSIAGAVVSSAASGAFVGAAIGGGVGLMHGLYQDSKAGLVKKLNKESIQFVEYGDTMTLLIPTDKYYIFMSPRLNELCYPGLLNVVRLLQHYPDSPIYIAAFTDNVGNTHHKKLLSQAQAETMMTYLWANGFRSIQLKPEGYADKYDIADNAFIHESAYNRRIEIQWFNHIKAQAEKPIFAMK